VWLVDGSPARDAACGDVAGCDVVGVPSKATPGADEPAPCAPVRPADVPARRAGLRGVGGVDQHEGDPGPRCLVASEGDLLGERPAVQGAPLEPMSPYPPAEALKILQGDAAAGAFGFTHHMLADLVEIGRAHV